MKARIAAFICDIADINSKLEDRKRAIILVKEQYTRKT